MAGEKIGKIERAGLFLAEARERLVAGIERVAVRAFDPRDPLLREHAVKLAAGAAIAIEAEDLVISRPIGADLGPHRPRDPAGMVVQLRREAGDIDVVEPERQHFAGERAAGDDEDFSRAVAAARVARFSGDVGGGGAANATVIPANAGIQLMRRRRLWQ